MNVQAHATDIVRKLSQEGYKAYFAGGWVRDHLMGHPSDDIDIATDAPPEKILNLFPRTILVGLAFGVVIVVIEGHQFEVATFRRDVNYVGGRKPTQIELSTPQEDASRRDFTINGMFYDPLKKTIYDYVGGVEDIKHQIIRTIGDPYERFVEDRLRMIRALRFSARFGFHIDPETQEAILANADTLFPAVAMERVWQEFSKMSKYPRFDLALIEMHRLELLPVIFPSLRGIHLNEIKQRVAHFSTFPEKTESILYLMQLFPEATEEDAEELCRYLKTSVFDSNLAKLFLASKKLVENEEQNKIYDPVEWTQFYAVSHAQKCLQIIATQLPEEKKTAFLSKHFQRYLKLEKHIKRIEQKKTLLNAALLHQHGIAPGKTMGLLIKEAERMAIIHDFDEAETVLNALKETPIWPKKVS